MKRELGQLFNCFYILFSSVNNRFRDEFVSNASTYLQQVLVGLH
jgi:hypothetical protein